MTLVQTFRLLIVEDSETYGHAMAETAKSVNTLYELIPTVVTSLAEAKRAIDTHDAMTLDLTLADAGSKQTVDWLGTLPKSFPVIVVTGESDPQLLARVNTWCRIVIQKETNLAMVKSMLYWLCSVCDQIKRRNTCKKLADEAINRIDE